MIQSMELLDGARPVWRALSVPATKRDCRWSGGELAQARKLPPASARSFHIRDDQKPSCYTRYARSRYRFPKILSIAHLGPDLVLGPLNVCSALMKSALLAISNTI
jgi:hypothetical protein